MPTRSICALLLLLLLAHVLQPGAPAQAHHAGGGRSSDRKGGDQRSDEAASSGNGTRGVSNSDSRGRSDAPCGTVPPLPSVVRFMIPVNCDGPIGMLDASPIHDRSGCAPDATTRGVMLRSFFEGLELYIELMRAAAPMPLSDGSNVTMEYTYVNFGRVDWNAPDWSEVSARLGTVDSGMARDALLTGTHGGPYTFVVPHMYFRDEESVVLANLCEDSESCILIHPFMSSSDFVVCQAQGGPGGPLPRDCVHRHKVEGMRRFDHFLGVLFDSAPVALTALETYHSLGARSIVIVAERGGVGGLPRFAVEALQRTIDWAKQLDLRVLASVRLDFCDEEGRGDCPKSEDGSGPLPGQTQILPDGHTPHSFALNLSRLNPDALICIGTNFGQSQHAFAGLFDGFRSARWTPRMLSWVGAGDSLLRPFMRNYDDLLYTWSTQPWHARLTGPAYNNVRSRSNFELLPANSTTGEDGPAAFARAFNERWGAGHKAGRGYDFEGVAAAVPVLGFHALTIGQKLVEMALTADVPSLILASLRVSVPSAYHQLQFDPFGRTARVNEVLLQYVPAARGGSASGGSGDFAIATAPAPHDTRLIVPYGIGVPPVFPMPSAAERVFEPRLYTQSIERLVAGANGAALFACLALLVAILAHRQHAVFRAATPSFCALTLLGALLMLLSNFFNTLVASDAHCAAHIWLLTLGFTLLFSALFVKTYRAWRVCYAGAGRAPQAQPHARQRRVDDLQMLGAVMLFVLCDVAINVAWWFASGSGSAGSRGGMRMREVVVDPVRPAFNYRECEMDNGPGWGALAAHLVLKCTLLVLSIALTWSVRHAPSRFNESSYIGVAVYNVSLVICFAVPLICSGVGGRKVAYLIRSFAAIFTATSTVAILFLPKLASVYSLRAVRRAAAVAAAKGPATGPLSIVTTFGYNANANNNGAAPGSERDGDRDRDRTLASKADAAATKPRRMRSVAHGKEEGGKREAGDGDDGLDGADGADRTGGDDDTHARADSMYIGDADPIASFLAPADDADEGEIDEEEAAYAREQRERDFVYDDLAALGASHWADDAADGSDRPQEVQMAPLASPTQHVHTMLRIPPPPPTQASPPTDAAAPTDAHLDATRVSSADSPSNFAVAIPVPPRPSARSGRSQLQPLQSPPAMAVLPGPCPSPSHASVLSPAQSSSAHLKRASTLPPPAAAILVADHPHDAAPAEPQLPLPMPLIAMPGQVADDLDADAHAHADDD